MADIAPSWRLSFRHPHASVLLESGPLVKGALPTSASDPQKMTASILTDHPVLHELIQLGIAALSVALPLFLGGLFGKPPQEAPAS